MSELNTNSTQEPQVAEVKKVNRRGISTARGTTRLKFTHQNAKNNGLFIAHLDNVEVRTITIGEDKTGMPSFNGLEIPKIVFTFASNEEDVNKRQYITLQFTAVESNAETIPGGKAQWKVDSVFDWFKHIMNVFVLKGRELTEDEANALSLNYEDYNEEGEYVPVEPEVVIAAWKTLFENFENIINRGKDGQPYYKTKDGKPVTIWLKLLRYIKAKNTWKAVTNGDLAIPTFVGEGCIEIFKQNTAPSIRIDVQKEDIRPRNIETAKAPNMPNVGMTNSMMGGVPVDNMMQNGVADLAGMAADDMPFDDFN